MEDFGVKGQPQTKDVTLSAVNTYALRGFQLSLISSTPWLLDFSVGDGGYGGFIICLGGCQDSLTLKGLSFIIRTRINSYFTPFWPAYLLLSSFKYQQNSL